MWAYDEAVRVRDRWGDSNRVITFETGYGPSGWPHIGTIGEIVRTSMVRKAYHDITSHPTRLICISDDLDALRKIPLNVDNPEIMKDYIGSPLNTIPCPYDIDELKEFSFSQSNTNMMIKFAQQFGYEPIVGEDAYNKIVSGEPTELNQVIFINSSMLYERGFFNDTIKLLASNNKIVNDIILPTLRSERKSNYCPFMPIVNGKVIQDLEKWYVSGDSTLYWEVEDPSSNDGEGIWMSQSIMDGKSKLQWKVDWCMRWMALGINYEMHGKDLLSSVDIGQLIVGAMSRIPPITKMYELFLDMDGKKIAKSKGNDKGVSIDDWLEYTIPNVFQYFMSMNPTKSRKVRHDIFVNTNDQYLRSLLEHDGFLHDGIWLIHDGIPKWDRSLTFQSTVSIVSLLDTNDFDTVLKMIQQYHPELTVEQYSLIDPIIRTAINYYRDFIAPERVKRTPVGVELDAYIDLMNTLDVLQTNLSAEEIQWHIYECGKRYYELENLKNFFRMIYEVLIGYPSGPRLGTFVYALGIKEFVAQMKSRIE